MCSHPPGKAVFLARDKHHLTDLCHLIRHDTPYLFQEYVKESHGRDVRVVLVGGRVIGSMLRCSTDGRMQSNCSLGKATLRASAREAKVFMFCIQVKVQIYVY